MRYDRTYIFENRDAHFLADLLAAFLGAAFLAFLAAGFLAAGFLLGAAFLVTLVAFLVMRATERLDSAWRGRVECFLH